MSVVFIAMNEKHLGTKREAESLRLMRIFQTHMRWVEWLPINFKRASFGNFSDKIVWSMYPTNANRYLGFVIGFDFQ